MTARGITRYVSPLNLADAFIAFFALLGPQKILVPVGRMARPAIRAVSGLRCVTAPSSRQASG